ncbi:hypothetical protein NVV95_08635 [Herbiconiux sp. CPCC 205716]|uniref:DUF7144 domain-containing protein n=1 Tax=Herbiconiux gentiana TaxID=2970912 RepID=A0ABT2GG78_9MICO|nr:hypothetical protein [Herbiconiux gentiana]MCS5714617.1 hypothetical protein [Herbiconiux gentiana]
MRRPGGVTLVAVIVWISGALQIIGGVIGLITAQTTAEVTGSAGSVVTTSIIAIVLGVVTIVVGAALLRGSQLARVLTTIVLALNLIGGLYLVIGTPSNVLQGILNAVLALIGIVLLYTRSANAYFRG